MTLSDDPFENARDGTGFLRLTNECPPNGVVIRILDFSKVSNSRFDQNDPKDEYNWKITHFTPEPHEKTLTESSKGFCTALKKLGYGSVKDMIAAGPVLHITWIKTPISKNRTMKEWTIKKVQPDDIPKIFSNPPLS